MRRMFWFASALAGVYLAGCAAVPRDRGLSAVNEQLTARGAPPAVMKTDATLPTAPLTLRDSVQRAFEHSPTVRELYAELGVSTADLIDARRLPNPTLSYARLAPAGGGAAQVTRGISFAFADLLLMPGRARLAGASYEIARERIAARLLALENDVAAAWYEYVAASQTAEVDELAAQVANASAEYARRLDAAGNLAPRALALELAAGAAAQVEAARARADALRARARFAALVGLSTRDGWRVAARLPATPETDSTPADLVERALTTRLDVAAARREVAAFESALTATRAWRWFGDFEVGYERETETDGARLRGPTFALQLPLFGFNRGGVLRAEAALDASRARLVSLELSVRNDLALAQDRLATAHDIAVVYRTALVPQREAATARTLEEVNFMLSGAFELLATRREQYAAYREYVEAVRDYWLARVDLERALGAHLTSAENTATLDLGISGERP